MSAASDRAKEILFDALDQPESERIAYLERACAGDDELRRTVEALLASHDAAGAFLGAPTAVDDWGGFPARTPGGDHVAPGAELGGYRIVRLLGEGGFGAVYLAEQFQPVERLVALKLLRAGVDSAQIVARFELERRALARMDHPAIARVFDAGVVDGHRPYVALEYVDGEPLTTYCDAHELPLDARLEVFEQVCLAVQHAHQKGIIHRDLKPSNVLVAEVDGRPVPKIIDFGIAKAITAPGEDTTRITDERQMIGTPEYMAPEQASMAIDEHDSRTDVYALGTLLYELLCGVPPFDPKTLRAAPLPELQRMLLQDEPPLPSRRLLALDDAQHDVARRRRTEAWRLRRDLRNDLDWVAMHAIEKAPERRYPTAYALAADVRRWLEHRPVEAGAPSRLYRVGKFARRHRIEVISAALIAFALIGGIAVSLLFLSRSVHAEREARERSENFEALADFAQSMLSGVNPAVARGEDTTLLRTILTDAIARVDDELDDHPEAEVNIRVMIAETAHSISDLETAETQLLEAVKVAEAHLDPESELAIVTHDVLARHYLIERDLERARPLLRAVLERRERVNGPDDSRTLATRSNLGYLALQLGDLDDAKTYYGDVLAVRERTLGPDDDETVSSRNNYATVLRELGDFEAAATAYRAVLDAHRAAGRESHPYTLATMGSLATCYSALDRHEEALDLHAQSVATKRQIYSEGHISLIIGIANYGGSLLDCERYADAEPLLEEAVAMSNEHLGPTDQRTLTARQRLASLHQRTNRPALARDALVEVLAELATQIRPEHPLALESRAILAQAYFDLGAYDDADQHALLAYTRTVDLAPNPRRQGRLALLLARIRHAQDHDDDALRYADEAIELLADDAKTRAFRDTLTGASPDG